MTKIKYFLLAIICLTLTNCKTEEHEFPLDKRYWDTNDYDKAILELRLQRLTGMERNKIIERSRIFF